MRYTHLTREHKLKVLEQRLLELESQHYQLEMNKQRMRASISDGSDEEREAAAQALDEIEARQRQVEFSHASDSAELEKLKPKKHNAKMAIPQGKQKAK